MIECETKPTFWEDDPTSDLKASTGKGGFFDSIETIYGKEDVCPVGVEVAKHAAGDGVRFKNNTVSWTRSNYDRPEID